MLAQIPALGVGASPVSFSNVLDTLRKKESMDDLSRVSWPLSLFFLFTESLGGTVFDGSMGRLSRLAAFAPEELDDEVHMAGGCSWSELGPSEHSSVPPTGN